MCMNISIWKRYHWNDVLPKSGLMFLVYEEYKDLTIELHRLKQIYTVQKLLMNIREDASVILQMYLNKSPKIEHQLYMKQQIR